MRKGFHYRVIAITVKKMDQNIYEIISDIADVDIEDVVDEALLIEDLNMDSLMIIDLSLKIEKIREAIVTPEEITHLKRVQDVIDLLS